MLNGEMSTFAFSTDLLNCELLCKLCTECELSVIFFDVYSVDAKQRDLFEELTNLAVDKVLIQYNTGFQDVAIKTISSNLPSIIKIISGYSFDEFTIWDAKERWEQFLFLKSARGKIVVEDIHDFYLCYNSAEKKVYLICSSDFDHESIHGIITKYTA